MKSIVTAVCATLLLSMVAFGQADFEVTGTPIPSDLLQLNYGSLPKSVSAFDLNICNISAIKQSIVSSKIYQALAQAKAGLQPVGRDSMLAVTLRQQNRDPLVLAGVALNSATGVLSVLGASKLAISRGLTEGAALASLSGQQLL